MATADSNVLAGGGSAANAETDVADSGIKSDEGDKASQTADSQEPARDEL